MKAKKSAHLWFMVRYSWKGEEREKACEACMSESPSVYSTCAAETSKTKRSLSREGERGINLKLIWLHRITEVKVLYSQFSLTRRMGLFMNSSVGFSNESKSLRLEKNSEYTHIQWMYSLSLFLWDLFLFRNREKGLWRQLFEVSAFVVANKTGSIILDGIKSSR